MIKNERIRERVKRVPNFSLRNIWQLKDIGIAENGIVRDSTYP